MGQILEDDGAQFYMIPANPDGNICPCPRCSGIDIWPEMSGNDWEFGLYCKSCQWIGPRESTDGSPDAAIAAWNREARKIKQAQFLGLTVNFDQPPLTAEEIQ